MKNKKTFFIISGILFFALAFVFFNLLLGKEGGKALVFCPSSIEHLGEKYRVVKVGERCWMAQNLRTTEYLDGSEIVRVDDDGEWERVSQGAYTVYPNEEVFVKDETLEGGCGIAEDTSTDSPEDEQEVEREIMGEDEVVRKFGYLYNFHAVNNPLGICPKGWSVPTHDDWTSLERALCTSSGCEKDFPFDEKTAGERGTNEGSKLAGFFHLWHDGDLKQNFAFDASDFDALPGGYRDTMGSFTGQASSAYFWSLADSDGGTWVRELHNYKTTIVRQYFQAFWGGLSVRCVRDR